MNAKFAPKGDKPEWQLVYDALLGDADFGTTITFEQLDEVLGREFVTNRAPLYRARDELGDRRKRWLVPVPGVGYRVTEADEHVRVAHDHKRKSRRQLGMAVRVLTAADLTRLSADGLAEWDAEQKMTFALWAIVAHENRIKRIEEVLRKEGLL
jgi:hypothetical protein